MSSKTYIFTYKENATDEEVKRVKDFIQKEGGTIKKDYGKDIGVAASFPTDRVHAATNFQSNDLKGLIDAVEEDQIMTTQ